MIKRSLILLAIIPFLCLAIYCVMNPVLATIICPTCFGYNELQNKLYVENGTSQEKRATILKNYLISLKKVEDVFGALVSKPQIIATTSQKQHNFIGGTKAKAVIHGQKTIQLSPDGLSIKVMTYEICRLELKSRLQNISTTRNIPVWFDKGLAIHISESSDSNHSFNTSNFPQGSIKKIIFPSDWPKDQEKRNQAIAESYLIVKRWVDKAGTSGINELIKRMQMGEDFEKIFQELGDRP